MRRPGPRCRVLVHLNAHNLFCLDRHPTALDPAGPEDVFLLEGIGLKVALWASGKGWLLDCNGTDTVPGVCRGLENLGAAVFLLGGAPGVAERAASGLAGCFPGMRIAGWHHGYFAGAEESGIVGAVNESRADLLLVGMGCPRQEDFLFRHAGILAPAVGWAVGGLFDFWAGEARRAPLLWRRLRLEWLYRCAHQPRRIRSRVLEPLAWLLGALPRNRLRRFSLS